MKLALIRRYRNRINLKDILSKRSPLLLLGLDLPFIVVGAVSLKNAAALSIEMVIIHLITLLVAWILPRKLSRWQRAIIISAVATGVMIGARELVITLFPDITNFMRLQLYLMAFNGTTLFQGIFMRRDTTFKKYTRTSFASAGIFVLVAFSVGGIREYLVSGTLWAQAVPNILKLSGADAPFFGFILLGFLLALTRYLIKAYSGARIKEQVKRDAPYLADLNAKNKDGSSL